MATPPPENPAAWILAARSEELATGPLGVVIGGVDIVLFRDERGHPRALRNECAHRQVKLSEGYVEDGLLICLYHRWTYNCEGRCVRLPHLQGKANRPDIRIDAFACREADGKVFVLVPPGPADAPPEINRV